MSWRSEFFSAEGRIGPGAFWRDALVLTLAWALAHALGPLGFLLLLVTFYSWICILSKRLHDAGRSGWLQALPVVLGWSLMALGGSLGFWSLLSLATGGFVPFLAGAAVAGGLIALALFLLGGLAHFLFVIWVGLARPEPGFNRYGPEPGRPLVA